MKIIITIIFIAITVQTPCMASLPMPDQLAVQTRCIASVPTDTILHDLHQLLEFNYKLLNLLEKNTDKTDHLDTTLIETLRMNNAHTKLQIILLERGLAESKLRAHKAEFELEKEKKKKVLATILGTAGGVVVGVVIGVLAAPR